MPLKTARVSVHSGSGYDNLQGHLRNFPLFKDIKKIIIYKFTIGIVQRLKLPKVCYFQSGEHNPDHLNIIVIYLILPNCYFLLVYADLLNRRVKYIKLNLLLVH